MNNKLASLATAVMLPFMGAFAAERVTDKEIELAREKVTLAQTELDTLLAKKEKQDTKTEKHSAKELSDEEQRLVNLFKQKKSDGTSADELGEIRKQIALLQAERREQEGNDTSRAIVTQRATPTPIPRARTAETPRKKIWTKRPETTEDFAQWMIDELGVSRKQADELIWLRRGAGMGGIVAYATVYYANTLEAMQAKGWSNYGESNEKGK